MPTELEQPETIVSAAPVTQEYIFFDAFLVMVKQRAVIASAVLIGFVGSVIVSFLLPVRFTARTRILPPKENNSLASALMGSQFGALASLANSGGLLKDANDTYVSMLKSQTLADDIIHQFDLTKVYSTKTMVETEKKLAENSDIVAGQDSIITVEVEDRDPARSAAIANAYIAGLSKLMMGYLNGNAGQRRVYLGEQLNKAEENLAQAEAGLKSTQERTGLITLNDQAKAIIESVAKLRAGIAATQVQLDGMRSFATPQNPEVIRLENELNTMRSQLAAMQQGGDEARGSVLVPAGKVPSAGLQYVDKLRAVKFSEALVELIGKQYELALLDESNSVSAIQVLDRASVPEKKSDPKRGLIVFLSTLTAGFIGLALAFFQEHIELMAEDPEGFQRLQRLRMLLRPKRLQFKA